MAGECLSQSPISRFLRGWRGAFWGLWAPVLVSFAKMIGASM